MNDDEIFAPIPLEEPQNRFEIYKQCDARNGKDKLIKLDKLTGESWTLRHLQNTDKPSDWVRIPYANSKNIC